MTIPPPPVPPPPQLPDQFSTVAAPPPLHRVEHPTMDTFGIKFLRVFVTFVAGGLITLVFLAVGVGIALCGLWGEQCTPEEDAASGLAFTLAFGYGIATLILMFVVPNKTWKWVWKLVGVFVGGAALAGIIIRMMGSV